MAPLRPAISGKEAAGAGNVSTIVGTWVGPRVERLGGVDRGGGQSGAIEVDLIIDPLPLRIGEAHGLTS